MNDDILTEEDIREMLHGPDRTLEQDFPGIDLAYPLAVASYETALKRLDSIDNRLQTLLAFVATISVVVPSIAHARGLPFQSGWFYGAVALFALNAALGTAGRLLGSLRVLTPETLFDGWLHKPAAEFKKDLIYFAARDFACNATLIYRKWQLTVVVGLAFMAQAACLAAWVLTASGSS